MNYYNEAMPHKIQGDDPLNRKQRRARDKRWELAQRTWNRAQKADKLKQQREEKP